MMVTQVTEEGVQLKWGDGGWRVMDQYELRTLIDELTRARKALRMLKGIDS
jgi:hypothetical protein